MPATVYVTPPAAAIDQGVILQEAYFWADDESYPAFVLTPTCDFHQANKCDYVLVCAAHRDDSLKELLTGVLGNSLKKQDGSPFTPPLTDAQRKPIAGRIKSELMQLRAPRYHFLPPIPGTASPILLDFQLVQSAMLPELANVPIIAQLASPFREQIPARYAAYMGRVGTEDFTNAEMTTWADAIIDMLFPHQASPSVASPPQTSS
jgi:hypothetical protein